MTIPRTDNRVGRSSWREAVVIKSRMRKGLSGKGNLLGAEILGGGMQSTWVLPLFPLICGAPHRPDLTEAREQGAQVMQPHGAQNLVEKGGE